MPNVTLFENITLHLSKKDVVVSGNQVLILWSPTDLYTQAIYKSNIIQVLLFIYYLWGFCSNQQAYSEWKYDLVISNICCVFVCTLRLRSICKSLASESAMFSSCLYLLAASQAEVVASSSFPVQMVNPFQVQSHHSGIAQNVGWRRSLHSWD